MEKCWANVLNNCDGGISREHVVSKCLFTSSEIDVKGFSWCKVQSKRIGIEAITKKCLCRKHNSELTNLDAAASHAFDVLRKQTKLSNDRSKEPGKRFKKFTFSINATALEKWLLKSLINFSYGSEYFIGHESNKKGMPSEHLVKVVFGIESFCAINGMYVAYKKGGLINFTDTVQFAPIIKDQKYIYGGKFTFRGVLLFMDISPDGMKIPFEDIPGTNHEWENIYLSKKFKQIKATHGNRVSHVVKFNWD